MKPSNTIVVSPKYIEEKEHQIADISKTIERLQEQLNEANEVIKGFMNRKPLIILCKEERDKLEEQKETKMAKQYLERFGVK